MRSLACSVAVLFGFFDNKIFHPDSSSDLNRLQLSLPSHYCLFGVDIVIHFDLAFLQEFLKNILAVHFLCMFDLYGNNFYMHNYLISNKLVFMETSILQACFDQQVEEIKTKTSKEGFFC